MIGPIPPKPTGSGSDATFMQWVWEKFRHLQLGESAGSSVNRTTRGSYQTSKPPSQASTTSTGNRLFNYSADLYGGFYGLSLGSISDIQGRDLGMLIPGWSSAVETKIVGVLNSNSWVKISLSLAFRIQRASTSASGGISLYLSFLTTTLAEQLGFHVGVQANQSAAAVEGRLFAQVEMKQTTSGALVFYEQAAPMISGYTTFEPTSSDNGKHEVHGLTFVNTSLVTPGVTGKIICSSQVGVNLDYPSCALWLETLTIDSTSVNA